MLSSDIGVASATWVHGTHRYAISTWFPSVTVSANSAWYVPAGDPDPVSLDGSVRWVGASVLVACYELPFLDVVGLHVPYFIVLREGGYEVPAHLACNGGGPGSVTFAEYDPTDPYGADGDPETDCATGSGGGGDGSDPDGDSGSGGGCYQESVVVEISNDGGATWTVFWTGVATVCE